MVRPVTPVQFARVPLEKSSEKFGESADTEIGSDVGLFELGGLLRESTASTA